VDSTLFERDKIVLLPLLMNLDMFSADGGPEPSLRHLVLGTRSSDIARWSNNGDYILEYGYTPIPIGET